MNLNPSEIQIPKQITFSSTNSNTNPLFFSPSIPQIQSQSQSISKIHFEINPNQPQIQNPSTPIHQTQIQNQTHFQYEPINQNPQNTKTLISNPQKRSLMTQNPPPISHHNTHNNITLSSHLSSQSHCYSNPFSIQIPTKELALKLFSRLRHSRWRLRLRFRFFLLLSLPSLYFFLSNPRGSVAIDIVSVFAFFIALLISLYFALPRLPSICPIKLNSSPPPSNPSPPVLWSIGSNPKLEKLANSGCGVQVYSNGDVYEGEFYKGKCSGSGVYYYYRSGKYEGDWIDEKYDGYGVETWARGSRYRGQYRHGLRHGFGVYRFYTGDGYGGEWCNGQSHGCGVHTCEDGSRYVGEFKWGVKHGLGHYHFRNGDTYAGEYFADKMHGFGVYRFGNGHHYEGAWHEGRRQGLGTYTFRNGQTQSGHWQNGVLDVRSIQNPTESPVSVIHSKVLNAVQEARQAADKAYNTAKVEERVNKAVAAANKSANAARVAAVKAVQNRMYENENNQH